MSTLIFWNKQNGTNQNSEQKNGKRNWLHAPEVLINGHVAYPVKVRKFFFICFNLYTSNFIDLFIVSW